MNEEKLCPNCGNEENGIFPCPHSAVLSAAEAQLAAVTKEKDQRQYLMDLASKEIKRMWDKQDEWEVENASLREALRDARPLVEKFVNAYVSGKRGSPADRQDQLRRLERIDAALKEKR